MNTAYVKVAKVYGDSTGASYAVTYRGSSHKLGNVIRGHNTGRWFASRIVNNQLEQFPYRETRAAAVADLVQADRYSA